MVALRDVDQEEPLAESARTFAQERHGIPEVLRAVPVEDASNGRPVTGAGALGATEIGETPCAARPRAVSREAMSSRG